MRAVDDPAVLSRLARVFRRAMERPCPVAAEHGTCPTCDAYENESSNAVKEEAHAVECVGLHTDPLPYEKGAPDDERA